MAVSKLGKPHSGTGGLQARPAKIRIAVRAGAAQTLTPAMSRPNVRQRHMGHLGGRNALYGNHAMTSPLDDVDLTELETEVADRKNVDDDSDNEETAATIYNISSYGADLSAEQHVKRMNNGAYIIPEFQRSYVWTPKKASRFIELLLLGLPVPSIFLYRDEQINKQLVIDGQQRLRTMQSFVKGTLREKTFRLTDVGREWSGKTYEGN